MDEWIELEGEYGEQAPSDGDACGEVTFGGGEGVGRGGALEEEEGKENKDFRPDTRAVSGSIDTESSECRKYNEDSGPTVVEREGEMDEEFV